MHHKYKLLGLLFASHFILQACATADLSAIEITRQIDHRIELAEVNHQRVINALYDEKLQSADRYIQTTWLPEFIDRYAEQVEQQKSSATGTTNQLLEETSLAIAEQIEIKTIDLKGPIEQSRSVALDQTSQLYDELQAATLSLLNYLQRGSTVNSVIDNILDEKTDDSYE